MECGMEALLRHCGALLPLDRRFLRRRFWPAALDLDLAHLPTCALQVAANYVRPRQKERTL